MKLQTMFVVQNKQKEPLMRFFFENICKCQKFFVILCRFSMRVAYARMCKRINDNGRL